MTRSGSPAARNRKPATTRHPPTPRSARTAPPTGRCPRTGSPSSTSLLACPRSRRTPGVRASGNSSTWTGLSDPPYDDVPPRRLGTVPSRQAGRNSRAPRATCMQPGPLKSVIYRYSPWRSPPISGATAGGRHVLGCLAGLVPGRSGHLGARDLVSSASAGRGCRLRDLAGEPLCDWAPGW